VKKLVLFLKRFGFIINIFAAVSLLLAYLAYFVPPDAFWPLAVLGLTYPFLLILNLFFLFFWVVQRSKNLILSLLVISLGLGHLNNLVQLYSHKEEKGNGIKILSYNVNYFAYNRKKNPSNSTDLVKYLKNSSADIICLQEVTIAKSGKFSAKGLQETLPNIKYYQLAHSVWFGGPVTFSKYPITNFGEIRFANTSNMVLFSDIKINESRTIRVYNCHLQSFQIRPDDYTIIENPTSGSNRLKLREIFELGHKLVTAFTSRAVQARTVARHIKSSPYPVVVCGDFNDTPWSYTYHTLINNLEDSFVESGFGVSNTYNGKLPSFRIDFLLHSDSYRSHSYKRDRVPYSDHFPVSCILEPSKEN
jgi:endonuclease/exonuclease/phosphatase family metal-dependent hydrolase